MIKYNYINELYVDDKEINKHKRKKTLTGFSNKMSIIDMQIRSRKIIVNIENDIKKQTLIKNIYNHIGMNSLTITDELSVYKSVCEEGYWTHKVINYGKKEYAKFDTIKNMIIKITTNEIENFWSVFKWNIKGTYIHIQLNNKWMQSYVNELAFRYNNKNKILLKEIIGRV